MSAYCIFDNIRVTDPIKLEQYKNQVLPVVEKFQGKYKVLGGPTEVIEGNWNFTYPIIIEFPSVQLAQQWYHSPDYKELKKLRMSAVICNALIIEGL